MHRCLCEILVNSPTIKAARSSEGLFYEFIMETKKVANQLQEFANCVPVESLARHNSIEKEEKLQLKHKYQTLFGGKKNNKNSATPLADGERLYSIWV